MDIILFRHGKAQDRALGLPDFGRRLIPTGRERTLKALDFLRERLQPSLHIDIYTSPAARALETAQLLLEGLALKEPLRILPGIYSGDGKELFASLVQQEEHVLALVVGHEPDLGFFCRHMTGHTAYFKTSGLAWLERSSLQPLRARLRHLYRADMDV